MTTITFGRQTCGALAEPATREWLVTDGLGGFATGTAGGLRTRRYHGLRVVATEPPIGRRLGLAALDPVIVVGAFFASCDRRTGDLLVKLPETRVDELVADGLAHAFAPAGRRFREWAAIAPGRSRTWRRRLDEALAFVEGTNA